MTLLVAGGSLDGLDEAIIRDQVPNPEDDLLNRAALILVGQYRHQTIAAAQNKYRELVANGQTTGLPIYEDDALISWYTTLGDYKDATVRHNTELAANLQGQIDQLTRQRDGYQSQLGATEEEAIATGLQTTINGIDASITAVQAEIDALTTPPPAE